MAKSSKHTIINISKLWSLWVLLLLHVFCGGPVSKLRMSLVSWARIAFCLLCIIYMVIKTASPKCYKCTIAGPTLSLVLYCTCRWYLMVKLCILSREATIADLRHWMVILTSSSISKGNSSLSGKYMKEMCCR